MLMKIRSSRFKIIALSISAVCCFSAHSQIGKRFPSERKLVKDPVTGTMLTFLTSTPAGDFKIYQTHNQWTSDGQWLIFRSGRVKGEAMAVHEKTGDLVQVTEGGYTGMLNIARKSMKLYFLRTPKTDTARRGDRGSGSMEVVEVDLAKLFADSKAGKMKAANVYQRVCGVTPDVLGAGGFMALDGDAAVITILIKPDKTADFEAVLNKLKESLAKNEKPERKQQAAGWKIFKSSQMAQGNAVYIFLINPVVKGQEYDITRLINEVFPSEVQDMFAKYKDSFAGRAITSLNQLMVMQ